MKRLSYKEIENLKKFAKEGKSLYKIMKMTGFGKTTIYYHVRHSLNKNSRIEILKVSDWERGYLIGLFIGDGNFWLNPKKGEYRVVFNFNAKSESAIIENTTKILKKGGGKPYEQRFENTYRITCISKPFYQFLVNFALYKMASKGAEKIMKKNDIRNFESWNKEVRYGFVAGMIDSDGFLGADKVKYKRIIITTYSENFSFSLLHILNSLDIKCSLQNNKKSGAYNIRISTPSYEKHKERIRCVKGR